MIFQAHTTALLQIYLPLFFFIYRSFFKIKQVTLSTFPSFEALCIRLTISSSSFTFLTIYRPPSLSLPLFISEFSSILDHLASYPSELVISGDFHIHFDSPIQSATFRALLDSYHLTHMSISPLIGSAIRSTTSSPNQIQLLSHPLIGPFHLYLIITPFIPLSLYLTIAGHHAS